MTTINMHGVKGMTITNRAGETESGKYRATEVFIEGTDTTIILFSEDTGEPLRIEDNRRPS